MYVINLPVHYYYMGFGVRYDKNLKTPRDVLLLLLLYDYDKFICVHNRE